MLVQEHSLASLLNYNDIVNVKDDNLPRNNWKLGKIVELYTDEDDHVRKVKGLMSDRNLDKKGKRIHAIVTGESPPKSQKQ